MCKIHDEIFDAHRDKQVKLLCLVTAYRVRLAGTSRQDFQLRSFHRASQKSQNSHGCDSSLSRRSGDELEFWQDIQFTLNLVEFTASGLLSTITRLLYVAVDSQKRLYSKKNALKEALEIKIAML